MTSRIQKTFYSALLVLLLAAAPGQTAFAQEGKTPESHAASPQASADEPKSNEAEKEKAGAEKEDPVRNSPSVKWIARHTGLTQDQAYWICIALNFAIIFFAIAGLMRKKLPGFFQGRTAAIQKGIEEARKASAEARSRLTDVESRLARLDADIAAMRSEAEKNAKAEEERILAASEEERRRIVASAEQEIAVAANTARRELRSYASSLAVDLAEKKIIVDSKVDESLVREFSAQLGKGGN